MKRTWNWPNMRTVSPGTCIRGVLLSWTNGLDSVEGCQEEGTSECRGPQGVLQWP